jgi:hypothetical protein
MKKGSKHTPEVLAKLKIANAKSGLARRGIPPSAEHRQHLSEANKGQVPWIKGRKQSIEHIEKRVQARIENGTTPKVTAPRGKEHYLWVKDRMLLKDDSKERGGQFHREWSLNVKSRDGWKCRISNKECSGRLESHHILGWTDHPELRYEVKNGITLCHFHHPRKRNDEMRLSPYFQQLVTTRAN